MSDEILKQGLQEFSDNWNERIAKRFKEEILPLSLSEFLPLVERWRYKSTLEFFDKVYPILKESLSKCTAMIEERSFLEINPKLRFWILLYLVAGFNGALPTDYPYLITLKDMGSTLYFSAEERHKLPGSHDCIHNDFVPFITMSPKKHKKDKRSIESIYFIYDVDGFIKSKDYDYFLKFIKRD